MGKALGEDNTTVYPEKDQRLRNVGYAELFNLDLA